MRLRSVDAHESRRLASFAVYAAGPVAVVAVWWLHGKGLIASTPMWVLAAIILGTGVANLATSIWLDRRPQSTLRLQVRIALSVLCTATVIYAAGWGSVLLIAYALGSAELLRTVGGRTVRPNMVWNWVAILAGEIAVAVGIAPTMIDPGLGHTIALVGGLCLMIVTDVLGRAAQATEAAQAQVRERGARFEALVERAADIIGVISTDGSVVSVSPAARQMLGYSPDEVVGQPISRYLHPDQVDALDDLLDDVVTRRGHSVQIEIRLLHRDGSDRIVVASLTSPSEDWGDQIVVNLHDVTTQRELEGQLRHDARHDPLTGLLNRHAFSEASERLSARAARHGWTVGMLFIDLDGFKGINDAFGHETGDRVLIETAERLTAAVRQDETLARLGGDEFAVLLATADDHEAAIRSAERIQEAIAAPIPGLPADVRVGASIGIALRSDDGIEMTTLMRHADDAMYRAKRNGKARWELSAGTADDRAR